MVLGQAYGFSQIVISLFLVTPSETGWFRQEATFYIAPNGSNISTLYADTRVGKYTAGLTGIVTDTQIDLGAVK